MLRRFAVGIVFLGVLLVWTGPVLAACTYSYYTINGRQYACTTCCWAGSCSTTCN